MLSIQCMRAREMGEKKDAPDRGVLFKNQVIVTVLVLGLIIQT